MSNARNRAIGARNLRLAAGALAAAAALTGGLSGPSTAAAASHVVTAAADSRVEQAYSGSNYGRSTRLRVDGGTDPLVETYLRFPVANVSGSVTSARLRVYATSGSSTKPSVHGTSNAWSEGGITWSNRPARTGSIATGQGPVAVNTWLEFDVTAAVSGNGTYSFVLLTPTGDGVNMASREASSSRPQLVVETATSGTTPPASTSPPAVSGSAREGSALTAVNGTWTGTAPIAYSYGWRRCDSAGAGCEDIPGATGNQYVIGAGDVGRTLRVAVTATNTAGSTVASSPATPAVVAGGGSWGGAVRAPALGAYFGAWTSGNTGLTMEQREAQIGRRYRIVHRYHDWNDVFPSTQEQAWARDGRILFLALEPRIYGSSTVVPWSEIAAGGQDAVIDAIAARVKALGMPVLMDFTHEPEEQPELGTPQQFAAAYRHVVGRFRAAGATNVSWVWTVMGYSGHYGQYAGGLYPGDDVVDWIGWDPYNWYVCHDSEWKSFERKVSTFYDWLTANGHADKPFMLSEYGSAEHLSDPLAKGAWFRDALGALKGGAFPNLKALVYFDSSKTGECDWRLDTSSASMEGYRQLANDPYLNP
jgi:hypothetical protein